MSLGSTKSEEEAHRIFSSFILILRLRVGRKQTFWALFKLHRVLRYGLFILRLYCHGQQCWKHGTFQEIKSLLWRSCQIIRCWWYHQRDGVALNFCSVSVPWNDYLFWYLKRTSKVIADGEQEVHRITICFYYPAMGKLHSGFYPF